MRTRIALGGAWALAALGLLLAATPVAAFEMEGATTRLEAGALTGGGFTDAPVGASGNRLDASIGQTQPIGVASGASGVELRAGAWHAVTVPEPAATTGAGAAALALAGLARRRRPAPRPRGAASPG